MGMSQLWTDIRIAIRGFRRTPTFTLMAVLTLGLGVGANTAIFSIVHGVLLRALPYPDAHEVVQVWPDFWVTKGWIRSFQADPAFESVSGVSPAKEVLNWPGGARELKGAAVNATYLDVLGLRPTLGRWFRPEDELIEAVPTVVISHDLWVREFGSSPDVLGRTVPWVGLGVTDRQIVGVMPPGLETLEPGWDFWVPIRFIAETDQIDSQLSCSCWKLVARLANATTPEVASERTYALATRLRELHPYDIPESDLLKAYVRPFKEGRAGGVGTNLMILFGAVTLVLLIACVNVANLLLVRATARRGELTVRGALGAARGRLVRQLMTESAVLGLMGGVVGVVIASGVIKYVRTVLAQTLPILERAQLDTPVLFFTIAVALLASLVFGTLPAYQGVRRADLSSRGGVTTRDGGRIAKVLVTAEVALTVVLVTGAGLVANTVHGLMDEDTGVAMEGLTTVRVRGLGPEVGDPETSLALFRTLEEHLAALPGVTAVGSTSALPLSGVDSGWQYFIQGQPVPEGQAYHMARFRESTPGYHATAGIDILAGRAFTVTDADRGAEPVALVNETLVRQHWSRLDDALGETIELNTGVTMRIVGVVEDVRHNSLVADVEPTWYRVLGHFSRPSMFLLARSVGDGPSASAVREALADSGFELLQQPVRTMEEVASESLVQARLYAQLIAAFAVLALMLGLVGIYGVTAYSVSQRVREIGLRMALGANRATVIRDVSMGWAVPLVTGLAIGLGGAALLSGAFGALVYGVDVSDARVYGLVPLCLILAGVAATALPAARAARLDPSEALRPE